MKGGSKPEGGWRQNRSLEKNNSKCKGPGLGMSLLGLKKVNKRTIVTVEGEVEIHQKGGETL